MYSGAERRFLFYFSFIGVQTLPAKLAAEKESRIGSGGSDETLLAWTSSNPPVDRKGNVRWSTALISTLIIFVGDDGMMDYR